MHVKSNAPGLADNRHPHYKEFLPVVERATMLFGKLHPDRFPTVYAAAKFHQPFSPSSNLEEYSR
jgi:hypothetical protein